MSAGAGAHGGWLRRVKLTEVAGRGRTCRRAPNPRPSPRSLRSFRLSPSGCNHMQSHAIPAASIESLPLPKSSYYSRWRRSGFFGAVSGLGGRLGAQARDRAFGRPRDTTRQHLSASGAG